MKLATHITSSLVAARYMRLPKSLLYNVESIVGPSSYLLNFVTIVIGVYVGLHLSMLNLHVKPGETKASFVIGETKASTKIASPISNPSNNGESPWTFTKERKYEFYIELLNV